MPDYRQFIQSKARRLKPLGFEPSALNSLAFDWQREVIAWSVRRGRAALFEDCGLGKTLQQLIWAEQVVRHTGGRVVIHCPIGVRNQTKKEAARFNIGVDVEVVDEPSQIVDGVNLVNYEKMHHFAGVEWEGVVLDESSILKSFTGKIKQQLCSAYSRTPYRLACTATPAPNDHMELGNHADFLGVMPSNEMLSRWFINDTMKAGGYRLKRHAAKDFWQWVASWAVCIEKPSDIGYSDDGYVLPPCREYVHLVDCEMQADPGFLFPTGKTSATGLHKEKRHTSSDRAAKAAEIVNASSDYWIVWCDTNYEADDLTSMLNDCVEVRGNDTPRQKEQKLADFSDQRTRVIVTKPTIAGFGMNWQHCCNVLFVGLSYSYEQYYQAIRRSLRFGQKNPVNVHIITTVGEEAAAAAVRRKQAEHVTMKHSMAEAMRQFSSAELRNELVREQYSATRNMEVPKWLSA